MTATPSVLFVCVHNAGRSQMAQGFLAHLAGDRIEVRSAGTEPGDRINPAAVEAMRELGIDIATRTPEILTPDTVQTSDVVITMGCGDTCPYFPGVDYRDWKLDDPAGQSIETVRAIRDHIRCRVEQLVAELLPGSGVPTGQAGPAPATSSAPTRATPETRQ
ncbi:arsenate reductase ArsC [Nocardia nova]|uniref:arsenate reductase ArsC n=1 Tax=Nocardia nova TaxID=37330 RepID=UPI0033FFC238